LSKRFNDYVVFDLETTVKCPIGNNKANPHWPDNRLICASVNNGETKSDWVYSKTSGKHIAEYVAERLNKRMIVGQNLAFDIEWLRKYYPDLDLSEKTLWDISIAEYVLTGQESKFPSLDEMAVKYGCPLKDDEIKRMWAAGVQTEDIPHTLLVPYCKQDTDNTEIIFLKQLMLAEEAGCLNLILVLNDALLATIEMTHNGMAVDKELLEYFMGSYRRQKEFIEVAFKAAVEIDTGYPDINLGSPKQLSALLFGGKLVYTERKPDGAYKTGAKIGETRYKLIKHEVDLRGAYDPKALDIPPTDYGWSTDDAALEKCNRADGIYSRDIAKYREVDKQLTTYFEKTHSLLFPPLYDCIHHNLNTTATTTGRLSSSEPNLQNVTAGEKSDIKKCYVSRFGDDGYIVELDFQQLEMVALAQLSNDEQLIADIEGGVDIHSMLYHNVFGVYPTKEQRYDFKRASFALIYGAGAKRIAKTVGIAESVAKEFIKAWGNRYPGTVNYWTKVSIEAKKLRQLSPKKDADGKPVGIAKYKMPTGRILTFTEKWTDWGGMSFSPNETKNYPVQSFATGDLVPLFLGKLYRVLLSRVQQAMMKGKCLMINTVHDSVLFDCHKDALPYLKIVLKNISDDLNTYIKKEFNIEMKLKLKTSVSYGRSWFDQKDINES
jgi:DNA polymerase I-like protein with 3'-5' exonuclease and polymerase domains